MGQTARTRLGGGVRVGRVRTAWRSADAPRPCRKAGAADGACTQRAIVGTGWSADRVQPNWSLSRRRRVRHYYNRKLCGHFAFVAPLLCALSGVGHSTGSPTGLHSLGRLPVGGQRDADRREPTAKSHQAAHCARAVPPLRESISLLFALIAEPSVLETHGEHDSNPFFRSVAHLQRTHSTLWGLLYGRSIERQCKHTVHTAFPVLALTHAWRRDDDNEDDDDDDRLS